MQQPFRLIPSLLFTALFFLSQQAAAQIRHSFSEDIRFADYLFGESQYEDAALLLSEMDSARLSPSQLDTLHYYLGWIFYNQKKLEASAFHLLKVSSISPYFLKARFFGAYDKAYLGRLDTAEHILQTLPAEDTFITVAANFELAGIALLDRDYKSFDYHSARFNGQLYATAEQEKKLLTYKRSLLSLHRRSPVVAGLLSAVVPGTGKMYAGKVKQGIGSLLPIAGLGVVTWELYRKGGFENPLLYVFGSAFTVFYVGNIWGSVVSVKITRHEHEKIIDQHVLLDMHIPLRTLFN